MLEILALREAGRLGFSDTWLFQRAQRNRSGGDEVPLQGRFGPIKRVQRPKPCAGDFRTSLFAFESRRGRTRVDTEQKQLP